MEKSPLKSICLSPKYWLVLLILVVPEFGGVAAQSDRIIPDRPGFSTGTWTVPVGSWYLESGYRYSFRDASRQNSSSLPMITVRTGLTPVIELFSEWDGFERNHTITETDGDLPSLGLKYGFFHSDDLDLTLVGSISNHLDGRTYRAGFMAGLMWEYELTDRVEHFGGIQMESQPIGGGHEREAALALGMEMEVAQKISAFVEYYTLFPMEERSMLHGTEVGILYYPSDQLQLDLHGGIGVSRELPHYIGLGVSLMFAANKR